MDAILKVVLPPLAAMLTVILKISNGDIDSSANPTFFFWLKVGPAVISLLVIILIIVIIFPFSFRRSDRIDVPYMSDELQYPNRGNGMLPESRESEEPMVKKRACSHFCCCCYRRPQRKNSPASTIIKQVPMAGIIDKDQGSLLDSDLEDDGLIVYNRAADSSGASPAITETEINPPESPPLLGSTSPRPPKPLRRKFAEATSESDAHIYDPEITSSEYAMTSFSEIRVLVEPELNLKLAQRIPSSSILSSISSTSRESEAVESSQTDVDVLKIPHFVDLPNMDDEPLPLGSFILNNRSSLKPVTPSNKDPHIPTRNPSLPIILPKPSRTAPPVPTRKRSPPILLPKPSLVASSEQPASSRSCESTLKTSSEISEDEYEISDGESGVSLNCDDGATTDCHSVDSFAPQSELSRSLKRNHRMRDMIRDNDLEVIDEFSQTMERIKSLLKDDDAKILEASVSTIERIVAKSERAHKNSISVNVGSYAHLDDIMTDLESVLEDIDTWGD